ncbi:hypothetical protein PMIN04_004150 [Paraphaeosphaeria minitans]
MISHLRFGVPTQTMPQPRDGQRGFASSVMMLCRMCFGTSVSLFVRISSSLLDSIFLSILATFVRQADVVHNRSAVNVIASRNVQSIFSICGVYKPGLNSLTFVASGHNQRVRSGDSLANPVVPGAAIHLHLATASTPQKAHRESTTYLAPTTYIKECHAGTTTKTRAMAQPTNRRTMRVARTDSIFVDTPAATPERTLPEKPDLELVHIPPHYLLPPTQPSPFEGTLEASLNALLDFGRTHPNSMSIMNVLRQCVTTTTNWLDVLVPVLELEENTAMGNGRLLLEELLFLATRTLLPEQIAQNRACMHRMYAAKRTTSMKMILRYDMLREWTKRENKHFIIVESHPPLPNLEASLLAEEYGKPHSGRRPLLANIWATLIAAPAQGYGVYKVGQAMKHHVTGLDKWLMFEDDEVAGWNTETLVQLVMQALLQWQWLRDNTERMEHMEVRGWEDLEGRTDECEWVRDDKRTKEPRLR